MRLCEFFLDEGVGPALLYHGTDCDNASIILANDILNGTTPQNAFPLRKIKGFNKRADVGFRQHEIGKFGDAYGVSLTRDPNFARRWKSGQGVVLVLDEQKLRNNFRVLPVSYYGKRDESEEFVVGSIIGVSKYLVAIEASAHLVEMMKEEDEPYDPEHGRYTNVLRHPLLKIVGDRWNPISGKIQNL